MSDEEIALFNAAETARMAKLQTKQSKNRSKERPLKVVGNTGIRGVKGKDQVVCISVRGVGLDNNELSIAGEELSLPREFAIRLQEAGAIRVKL